MTELSELFEAVTGDADEVSFAECKEIKKAGELYREESIDYLLAQLDLTRQEAEGLIKEYITLVTEPPEETSIIAMIHGAKFFSGRKSIEEILDQESDSSRDDIKRNIQKFVSAGRQERKFEDTDISTTLPEDTNYPDGVEEAQEMMTQLSQKVNSTVSQMMDFSGMMDGMMNSIMEPLRRVGEQMRRIEEHIEDVRTALEENISNFDSPGDYDPEEIEVDPIARNVAESQLGNFVSELENCGEDELESYAERLAVAYRDFEDGNYYSTIFIVLSVQDGLMHWICEENNVSYSDSNKKTYSHERKMSTLYGRYDDFWGIETGNLARNLNTFWNHRHSIMHGDPEAEFDENIATISILFLMMTLDTALKDADVY